jgi:hypothetical protein
MRSISRLACIAAGATLAVFSGCQSVGPTFEQSREGVQASEVSASKLAYSDSEGQETVTSSGPLYRTTIEGDGTIQAIGGGLASREFVVPGKILVRSNTDISGKVDELYDGGELVAKGFEITTRVTEPQGAANAALADWVKALATVTPEQRMALEAQMLTIREGVNSIAPGLFEVLKTLVLP